MKTVAEEINKFNESLHFKDKLPEDIFIMNPFKESKETLLLSKKFYSKYYSDNNPRKMILGINPGRNGAGVTGVPFSDTKRLKEYCGIEFEIESHEPSSVFIYKMILAYGGVKKFYSKFYINSLSPLGFLAKSKKGNLVNYNYYDSKELIEATTGFIVESVKAQIKICKITDVCFCLGEGKNFKFFSELNNKHKFFKKIIPLSHPRFIVQYKTKLMDKYIEDYLKKLRSK